MDDRSSYCGCCSKIKNVLDAAMIANIVMTGAGDG